jgi:NADPH:quinone reductase-like Zn-dependent oxidoreductase
VLIEVHAVSVNRTLDLIVRGGKYAHAHTLTLPHVLGVDPSGIIVKVGPGVTDRKVGDRVATTVQVGRTPAGLPILLGVHVWGGYAQYCKVPASITHLIPEGVDYTTATVVTRHAPMAFHLLRDRIKVKEGEWVLVMGAAGGLGSAGVQVAKYLGAKVIAAAGADERVKVAMDLGADAGVNYRSGYLTAEVMRITERRGVDVVFENIGDPVLFPKALASMTSGGRMVTAGSHGGGTVPLDVSRLYLYQLTIMGAIGEGKPDVQRSMQAAAEGSFKVLIDKVLPLSEAAKAHEIVAGREGVGKVVLDPWA